jgi:CBS domain-containing protein
MRVRLAQRRISGMPVVVKAGTVIGMVTEEDLLRWYEDLTERQACWLDPIIVTKVDRPGHDALKVIRQFDHRAPPRTYSCAIVTPGQR